MPLHLQTLYISIFTPSNTVTIWRETLANLTNCPWFTKLKPSKLVLTINNLLADLLIRQTFFCQMLKTSPFAKLFLHTVYYSHRVTINSPVYLKDRWSATGIFVASFYELSRVLLAACTNYLLKLTPKMFWTLTHLTLTSGCFNTYPTTNDSKLPLNIVTADYSIINNTNVLSTVLWWILRLFT